METLNPDERAAIRAFLQRSDVRLSTIHRVATALLSGAGLMVLLPAIARDSVVSIMRALIEEGADATRLLLLGAVVTVLALPFVALWLLLRDLTRFYFHAQHLHHADTDVFTPRFTLTGLRLPLGELEGGAAALDAARLDPSSLELLVPPRAATRLRIDRQLDAYGGLGRTDDAGDAGDIGRANGLFELVASRSRDLVEEVAKVEHGMVRHILRIQVIVLRYVKALLAFLTTALAVFGAAAVVEAKPGLGPAPEIWLCCVFLVWAPCVVIAVNSPVRWLEQLLRSEGAAQSAVRTDQEFTRVERIATGVASAGWGLSLAALVVTLARDHGPIGTTTTVSSLVIAALSAIVLGSLLAAWRRRAQGR